RAEPGDHAGTQVVAIREPARQHDRRDAAERALLVPQRHGLGAGQLEAAQRVAVAVRAGEDDDADPCQPAIPTWTSAHSMAYDSISGFEKSSAASRSTVARASTSV